MPKQDILRLASDFPPVDEGRWRSLVKKALKGEDFERELVSRTVGGLRIEPLYTRKDATAEANVRPAPAVAPWEIRQVCADLRPAAANATILDELQGGARAIALRTAAPEQAGLQIGSVDDLARALEGVPLEPVGIWLEAGVDFASAAETLQSLWKARGIAHDKAQGGFGADPLGNLARAGGLPVSLEQALGETVGLVKRACDTYPKVKAIVADGRPYHDGGASEAQELACLCATAVAYLRACENEQVAPDSALPHIAFAIAADADLFLTIAKLRAARLLVARLVEATGASRVMASIHLHATTSRRMMAKRDPYTNMLRTTVACAGAALGGADAITVLPFTWPLGQPDSFARRIGRNIQLILQQEASLSRVADPAGGSWAIEKLTSDIASEAWERFQHIEAMGGMAQALASGAVQELIRETADARLHAVATGKESLTGVTSFPYLEEGSIKSEPWPLPDELDPAITVEPIPLRRPAEPFENLRNAADAYLDKHGERPKVFLATLGSAADFTERAAYAAGLFAAGGIESISPGPLADAEAAGNAFRASGAKMACLCGSDEAYAVLGAEAAGSLRSAGAKHVYLAGRPGEMRQVLKEAGVETFLHPGCDMLAILKDAHDVLGVR